MPGDADRCSAPEHQHEGTGGGSINQLNPPRMVEVGQPWGSVVVGCSGGIPQSGCELPTLWSAYFGTAPGWNEHRSGETSVMEGASGINIRYLRKHCITSPIRSQHVACRVFACLRLDTDHAPILCCSFP